MTYLASALKEGQNVNLTFESQNADHLYRLLQCLINIIVIRIEDFDYFEGDLHRSSIERLLLFGV